MKIIRYNLKIIVSLITSLFVMNATASVPISGEIIELWVNDTSNSNIVFIATQDSYTTPCFTSSRRYLIIDLTEPGMKEAYSMALAAFMSGSEITMAGLNGDCYGIHEKLKYINMIK